jgi:hypothetical protein
MLKNIKFLGVIAIIAGSISTLLCLIPMGFVIALPVGFIGMIISGVYVFIDTKTDLNKKKITPGIIGMLLSSVPVLFILLFTIIRYFKN